MIRVSIERLKEHPLALELIPQMRDEEYLALVESVRRHGIMKPLDVIERDEEYLVVDGVHRLRAARECRLRRVPVNVLVLKDDEVEDYILSIQTARRNLTPAQKAALAIEWMERRGWEEAEAARRIGVSRKLISVLSALKKKDPEFYELVRQGAISLTEAERYLKLKTMKPEGEVILETETFQISQRIEKLEEEKALLQEELQREKKTREELLEVKKRLRKLESEKKELRELIKELYAIASHSKEELFLPSASREELLQLADLAPSVPDFPVSGENAPLTERHLSVLTRLSVIISFLRTEASSLLRDMRSLETFPSCFVEKVSQLFSELRNFLAELTDVLTCQALQSPSRPSSEKTFLVIRKHEDDKDSTS